MLWQTFYSASIVCACAEDPHLQRRRGCATQCTIKAHGRQRRGRGETTIWQPVCNVLGNRRWGIPSRRRTRRRTCQGRCLHRWHVIAVIINILIVTIIVTCVIINIIIVLLILVLNLVINDKNSGLL